MKQYRIDELLAHGEQWFNDLDDDALDALAAELKRHPDGELTVPIVLSERGRLLDGHQRLMALQRLGRSTIKDKDVRIDHTAVDAETEATASISYQSKRRQLGGAERAKVARGLMQKFGWSQGRVAQAMGVSRSAVSQVLAAYPDPSFVPPDKVTGIDGKDYTVTPDPEPTAKRGRAQRDYTPVAVVDDYSLQLCNPGWGQWIRQWGLTAPEEETVVVANNLKLIASACAMIAEGLVGEADNGESF